VPDRACRGPLWLAAVACLWGTAVAGDPGPEPAADADLLEFLGSVDSGADSQSTTADDGSWIEYLAQTDIGKVAKSADGQRDAAKKPAADQPSPASGDKKNE
jgi:hypothetical protein